MRWSELRERFGVGLVDAMQARLLSGSSPQVDKTPFMATGHSAHAVDALFDALIHEGQLERWAVRRCSICKLELPSELADDGVCPHCDFDMGETGEPPFVDTVFISAGEPSREIPWLVALHGFNTHGDWQEEFGWLLATRFRHRAPALMHKFTFLFFGVLLRSRHEALAVGLDRRLRTAIDHARRSGIVEPPDIIAHSFGSLLLVRLLDRTESADLKFGRIVVAGSIVRPDYDWSRHIQSGRIEAVLNHCSRKDSVVGFAQWAIPDSGPSGRHGFDNDGAINHVEDEFDHGTHFDPGTMIESLRHDGLWDRFLRLPINSLAEAVGDRRPDQPWKPAPALIVMLSRATSILFAVMAAPLVVIKGGIEFLWKGTV